MIRVFATMYSIQTNDASTGARAIFARRPVLDAGMRTVGYEVLLPEGRVWTDEWRELLPAAQTIYLPVTLERLLDPEPPSFAPAAIALMLAHEGRFDDPLLAGLRVLAERGFKIVLDAPSDLSVLEPVLQLAHIVRLDVLALGLHRARFELAWLKGRGVAVLAAEVHTEDAFAVVRDAGADLFQGLFYERRHLAVRRSVPVAQIAALAALLEPVSGDAEFDRLEDLIRRDAGLCYRLLRYANSAFVGVPRPLGSIREALVRLGARVVRQWALALVLSGLEDRPHALLNSTLVRARTCELLVSSYDRDRADQAFTTGLLSMLDALLGAPLEEILDELPLCDEVVAAIVGREGVAGKALEKVIAYERGHFGDPALAGHAQTVVAISYLDATRWADGLL